MEGRVLHELLLSFAFAAAGGGGGEKTSSKKRRTIDASGCEDEDREGETMDSACDIKRERLPTLQIKAREEEATPFSAMKHGSRKRRAQQQTVRTCDKRCCQWPVSLSLCLPLTSTHTCDTQRDRDTACILCLTTP